jgi:general secretion pathway protein H
VKRREGGFSLFEMLTVLALLALAASIMLPMARKRANRPELAAFAQETTAYLRFARSEAIAQNREKLVRFDFDRRTVSTDGVAQSLVIPASTTVTIVTASGEVKGREASIRFFPNGGASGGNISIGGSARRIDIAINWLTGAVVVLAP